MIKRLPNGFSKTDFVDGDLFCYYIGLFSYHHWFPRTFIYEDEYNLSFDFFNRIVSLKHFEKVKAIMQVDTIEELKVKLYKINAEDQDNMRYSNSWSRVSPLIALIKAEMVDTSR